ncbi:MAG: signal peptide peptidase SppA [Saprospiraceae bacterium]|nr:signal peptide peptidase SppA [Saprospiraceae bacterium]
MKQFFKFVFASCLGLFLAGILLVVSLIAIGSSAMSGFGGSKHDVKANSVLTLKLDKVLPEKTNNSEVDFSLENTNLYGLNDIIAAIRKAKSDSNIKGILIEPGGLSNGKATASTIRAELLDFKSSGKFIYSYGDYFTQEDYYYASVADKIILNPIGAIEFKGFGAIYTYFKDMLDRLNIETQVFYVGQFKSATEPFRYNKMSDQNRTQVREYLESLFSVYLNDISTSRKIPIEQLEQIADGLKLKSAEDAKSLKFVDELGYESDLETMLKQRLGLKSDDKINKINIYDYCDNGLTPNDLKIKDKIAVIYAEGEIVDGKGTAGKVGDEKYVAMIRKIRKDNSIKAIVLRVNSPGGSAIASENILRELELAKKDGKPVVVSMGDVAASGGYYISCLADSIFAQKNSITGSIGVFGIIPSIHDFMKSKIGITYDSVKTNTHATGINAIYKADPLEAEVIQSNINSIYKKFLQRVSSGRHKTEDQIHEIAQGRVWTGEKALQIGLVDKIGSLDDAVVCAANLAKLKKYRKTEYPRSKEPIQQLIEKITKMDEDDIKTKFISSELGELAPFYLQLKQINQMKGAQMRMPFDIQIK